MIRPATCVLALVHVGCADMPARAPVEDVARATAPVPVCSKPRQAPPPGSTAAPRLREEEAWALVFPSFDAATRTLPAGAAACTGKAPLADAVLAAKAPAPFVTKEGDVVFATGADRLQVVWLRSVRFDDGTSGGAIALVRALPAFAEAYGVGAYRGADRTRFEIHRVGPHVVVSAEDDACAERTGEVCESVARVYLPRRGELVAIAAFATARVGRAAPGEPGARGEVEYRLTTAVTYQADGVHVVEQVRALDDRGRELRTAEQEQRYMLHGDRAHPTLDPLWDRIFPQPARPP